MICYDTGSMAGSKDFLNKIQQTDFLASYIGLCFITFS